MRCGSYSTECTDRFGAGAWHSLLHLRLSEDLQLEKHHAFTPGTSSSPTDFVLYKQLLVDVLLVNFDHNRVRHCQRSGAISVQLTSATEHASAKCGQRIHRQKTAVSSALRSTLSTDSDSFVAHMILTVTCDSLAHAGTIDSH